MEGSRLQSKANVEEHVASLDDETHRDTLTLMAMMRAISGCEPELWNVGTIGFDSYHYKYASGREGDSHIISFYPRKGKITVYLMDGTVRHAALLAKLGNHATAGYCIYIKRLSDVDLGVLEQIVRASYEHIKTLSRSGPIDRILWQTEK